MKSTPGLNSLVSFFLLCSSKGLVQTCSHPVVSETDDLTFFDAEKVVSTKSYFALWDALLSRNPIYNSFVGAIVQILEKLDLSTEIVRYICHRTFPLHKYYPHTVDVRNPNVQISALFKIVWLSNRSDFGRSVG